MKTDQTGWIVFVTLTSVYRFNYAPGQPFFIFYYVQICHQYHESGSNPILLVNIKTAWNKIITLFA